MVQPNSFGLCITRGIHRIFVAVIVLHVNFFTAASVHSQQWLLELDLVTISQPTQWNNLLCFAGSARKENVVRIFFVELSTGKLVYSHATKALRGQFQDMDLRSTPCISIQNLAFSFSSGVTVCFAMAGDTPKVAWEFDLQENMNYKIMPFGRTAIGSPGITATEFEGAYFVPTGKISSDTGSAPTLVCLESTTGKLKWSHMLLQNDARYPTAAGATGDAGSKLWFQDGDGVLKLIDAESGVTQSSFDQVEFSWFPPQVTQKEVLIVKDSELTSVSARRGLFSLTLPTRIGASNQFLGTEIRPSHFLNDHFFTDPLGRVSRYHAGTFATESFESPEQYEYVEFATPIIHQSLLFIPVSNFIYVVKPQSIAKAVDRIDCSLNCIRYLVSVEGGLVACSHDGIVRLKVSVKEN